MGCGDLSLRLLRILSHSWLQVDKRSGHCCSRSPMRACTRPPARFRWCASRRKFHECPTKNHAIRQLPGTYHRRKQRGALSRDFLFDLPIPTGSVHRRAFLCKVLPRPGRRCSRRRRKGPVSPPASTQRPERTLFPGASADTAPAKPAPSDGYVHYFAEKGQPRIEHLQRGADAIHAAADVDRHCHARRSLARLSSVARVCALANRFR
jgi:hypothetical protein